MTPYVFTIGFVLAAWVGYLYLELRRKGEVDQTVRRIKGGR